jgi:hypothetical protein
MLLSALFHHMPLTLVYYCAWVAGIVLLGFLVAALAVKKLWKKFPIFSAYAFICFLQAIITYLLHGRTAVYEYVYWPLELTGMFLGLGVVYEIFTNLFAGHSVLRKLATTIFQSCLLLLFLIGCIVMYTHAPVQGSRLAAASYVLEEGIRIIEVGVVVLLFVLSGAFGLHWRQTVFGIAFGLAIFVTMELAGISLVAHVGNTMLAAFMLARAFSFDLSLLIWLGYLLAPERVTIASEVPQRGQLEQWNRAVKELIYQ